MQNCSVQSGTTLLVHWSLLQWSILMEMWNLEHNVIMHRLILYVKASLQSALHASRWFEARSMKLRSRRLDCALTFQRGDANPLIRLPMSLVRKGGWGSWRGCTYKEWCRQQQQQQCSMFTLPSADKRHCSTTRSILAPSPQFSDQWCCEVLELPCCWCYPVTWTSCLIYAFFSKDKYSFLKGIYIKIVGMAPPPVLLHRGWHRQQWFICIFASSFFLRHTSVIE